MIAATRIHDFLLMRPRPMLRVFAVQWRSDDEDQFPRVMRVLAADEGEARDMLQAALGRSDFTLSPL